MKIKAAVFEGVGEPINVEEIELEGPREGEVQVRVAATGVCHSDYHVVKGEWGRRHQLFSATKAPASSRQSDPG